MSKGENSRVLVIVDDKNVRDSISVYFDQEGYRVAYTSLNDEALECFHSFSPDLVLCELNEKDSKGIDLAQSILSVSPVQAIMALSSKENTAGLIEAMQLGVDDFFIWPVDDMAIFELAVRKNLKRSRIIEENRNYHKKLEVINQELESTLEIFEADQKAGRHVQVSMLPDPPQTIGPYHFNHKVIPSLYLSGDSVDYKPVSKHKVLFYIADVSGHGSSSAFLTILLRFRIEQMRREFIRGRFSDDFTPASILSSLNTDLIDSGLDKHITMFVGLLDNEDNSLVYSVAGHHPLPILFSNGEASFITIEKSSFPIGLLEEAEYFEEALSLDQTFSLTLFSDGILEILQLNSMLEKEDFLLETITSSEGDFEKVKTALGLETTGAVPDDIAVMSVSRS